MEENKTKKNPFQKFKEGIDDKEEKFSINNFEF